MNQELVQAVREKNAILFVGAGVSQGLGLPTHEQLISYLATELGYDPELFATRGDYLLLAEFYQIEKGTIGPLRSWLDRTWHTDVDLDASEVHKLIVELDFPIIYTTNYDTWLERAYELYGRRYVKVANVSDLAKARDGMTQIVKFHGDFDNDASIVLTESSYFNRLDFESPLDVKLRADLLGKTVLFVGYSLADINIRYMLYRLSHQWTAYADARPKSFVFLARPNPIQERILSQRGINAVVSESDDPTSGLLTFLRQLSREALGRTQEA